MNEAVCGSCKYFRRHYVKIHDEYYMELSYGHCAYPRMKRWEADTPACKHYEKRDDGPEEAVG